MNLTAKQKLALTAFETRAVVYAYHLPTFVGEKTMAQLVELGLVERVQPQEHAHSRREAWRLVGTMKLRATAARWEVGALRS